MSTTQLPLASVAVAIEGSLGVLKHLLLPAIEHCGIQAVTVAHVRYGDLLDEMLPEDPNFLLSRTLPAILGHGHLLLLGHTH